ncbi:MAG: hypothetical protein Q9228_007192 [Teloschistes exilis]
MIRDSDIENDQELPSPYQLELLISALNGSLLTFRSFATYSVSTVQYFAQEPLPLDSLIYDTFAPSRKISPTCVDLPPSSQSATPAYHTCIGLSTGGNSEVDKEDSDDIVVSDPQGWLTVPRDLPADINFVATTIGSSTSCRNVTQLCDLAFTWTAMKSSSSFAFVSAMGEAWARSAQLQRIGILSYSAQSDGNLASEWASTYDQTMLHTGNGMLVVRDPVNVGHSLVAQVTRIPRAPLLTLIILDLLYALVGTCLAIAAFKAVRKGRSVRDAQARLSTLAIVAESFESPAWGTDARDVGTLFAERRGEPTRRIALVKQADGKGRKYKQLVVPKEHVKRAPTTEEFLARKTRLGMGESQV